MQVVLEVRQAQLEYDQARSTWERIQKEILPNTLMIRDTLFRQFRAGEVPLADYLTGQQEYNDRVSQFI